MKFLALTLLMLTVGTAAFAGPGKYKFIYTYANAFKSEEDMKQDVERQLEKINTAFLRPHGMEAKVISVEKNWTHKITGEVVGVNCTPSLDYYQKIKLADVKWPVGVEQETVAGVAIVMPHDPAPQNGSTGGSWDNRYLLVPVCQ